MKRQRKRQFRSFRASFSFAVELLSARLSDKCVSVTLNFRPCSPQLLGFVHISVSLVNISLSYPLSFFRARKALEGEISSSPQKASRDIVVQEMLYLHEKGKRYITPWTLSCVFNGTFANIRKATALWRLRPKVVMSRSFTRVFIPSRHASYHLIYCCFVLYSLNILMYVVHDYDFCYLLTCSTTQVYLDLLHLEYLNISFAIKGYVYTPSI